jgi:hypothetical protein
MVICGIAPSSLDVPGEHNKKKSVLQRLAMQGNSKHFNYYHVGICHVFDANLLTAV